ncbi:MAG: serine/threonine-protein phosphatase 6 regulatory ankyrin repeat subunit A-like [Rickettsiaceae bacterium]|jgi:ankyrin repeat protein|nr:serine/threonine-protein phosphatase 6 regulatory ankyrin repeat subunit A-like [Rickettsiaceae bacterium]
MPFGIGRLITNPIKTIEKAITGKPQSGGGFFSQQIQAIDEFAEAIKALQQEITTLKQQLSTSSLSFAQIESQLSSYQSLLNMLRSDKDYISNKINMLEHIKQERAQTYEQMQKLAELKGHELFSKINDFKQLISNNSDNEAFKDYFTIFAVRQLLTQTNQDTTHKLLPTIKSLEITNINAQDEFGKTALFYAVQAGNKDLAEQLIQKGADVNHQSLLGYTPLHIAVRLHKNDMVQLLLNNGADSELTNVKGQTPLMQPLYLHDFKYATELAKQGLSVQGKNIDGENVLHLILNPSRKILIDESASIGSMEWNTKIIKDFTDAVSTQVALIKLNTPDNRGDTPLIYAAANNDCQTLIKLLHSSEEVDLINNVNNINALHAAAIHNSLDTLKILAQRYPQLIDQADSIHATPLYYATLNGYKQIVNYIFSIKPDCKLVTDDNDTMLHAAAQSGNLDLVRLFLSKGLQPNTSNALGGTALYIASEKGYTEIVEYLLQQKVIIIPENTYGDTALHIAVKKGHLEIVKLLACIKDLVELPNFQGVNALHLASYIGNLEMVKFLGTKVKNIDELTQGSPDSSVSPLFLATQQGNLSVVEHLISLGAKADMEVNHTDKTFHIAVRYNRIDVIKFLIGKVYLLSPNKQGLTAFHLAVLLNQEETLKTLLPYMPNIDYPTQNENKFSALYIAATQGFPGVVKLLLDNGANPHLPSGDSRKFTPLHNAVYKSHNEVAKLLISKMNNVEQYNDEGFTAFHIAALKGNFDIVEALLPKIQDINIKTNNNVGGTAIYCAAQEGHSGIVKLLLENNADYTIPSMQQGLTSVMKAAMRNHIPVMNLFVQKPGFVDKVENSGYNVLHCASARSEASTLTALLPSTKHLLNSKAGNGTTPLHQAVITSRLDNIKLLIEIGADINQADNQQVSPLYGSLGYYGNKIDLNIIKYLIDHNADVSQPMFDGDTPMHMTGYKGAPMVAKLLLDNGAAIDPQNHDGNTPLHVCIKQVDLGPDKKLATIKYFLLKGASTHMQDKEGHDAFYFADKSFPDCKTWLEHPENLPPVDQFEAELIGQEALHHTV